MISQLPSGVLMIRPHSFGVNEETSVSNKFQESSSVELTKIAQYARDEFDDVVQKFEAYDIPVFVFEELDDMQTPDAVFPNNWISFHPDGTVVIYPMESRARRNERRYDLLFKLETEYDYQVTRIIDLSCYEFKNHFLESTGSLIFDYPNKTAFICRSSRSSQKVAHHLSSLINIEMIFFDSRDKEGYPIYHTNVMMCIAENFVVVCLESIPEGEEKEKLISHLQNTGREIIEISLNQVYAFAGNMFQVRNRDGEKFLIMSSSAYDSLNTDQREKISNYSKILHVPIPSIQKYGGGSIRCMLAGIMLPFYNPKY